MSLKLMSELQCTEVKFIRGIIKKVFCYRTLNSKKKFSKGNKNESGVTTEGYSFYRGVSVCHNTDYLK
jgi:hypothetical protein